MTSRHYMKKVAIILFFDPWSKSAVSWGSSVHRGLNSWARFSDDSPKLKPNIVTGPIEPALDSQKQARSLCLVGRTQGHSHSSGWSFHEPCYILLTLRLLPMAWVLRLPHGRQQTGRLKVPLLGTTNSGNKCWLLINPSRSLTQMFRVADHSVISQTGRKLLFKATPLKLSSLLPEPIILGDM